jgi:hypothetical protein
MKENKVNKSYVNYHRYDIIDTKEYEKRIKEITSLIFEEKIIKIVILSQNDFFKKIESKAKALFDKKYKDKGISFEHKQINKCYKDHEKELIETYKNVNKLVTTSLEKYKKEKDDSKYLLTKFQKHCKMTDDIAFHNCEGKMYIIYEKDLIRYVVCGGCKKLYNPSAILLFCYFCSVEYSSDSLTEKVVNISLPATWESYHCKTLCHDRMRCIKCKELFFLNTKENILFCQSCNFKANPLGIIWQCQTCKEDYKCSARPFNIIEEKIFKKLVKDVVNLQQKAKPLFIPCCNLRVFDYVFFHKKNCDGELFQGEHNSLEIIVCSKCKMLSTFDNFIWTCPKCFKRFRKTIKDKKSTNMIDTERNPKKEEMTSRNKDCKQILEENKEIPLQTERKIKIENRNIPINKVKPKSSNENIHFNKAISSKNDEDLNIKENVKEKEIKIIEKNEKQDKLVVNETARGIKNEKVEPKNVVKTEKKVEPQKIGVKRLNSNIATVNTNNKTNADILINKEEKNCEENPRQSISFPIPKKQEKHLYKLTNFNIDDYKILQSIGEGANGVIYIVQNAKKEKFAMKKMIINNEIELEMYINEYEIMYKVNHPNVIKILGFCYKILDDTINVLYILMELAKSDWHKEINLRAKNNNPYTEDELINIMTGLIDALCFLQLDNVTHRDIKPHNILIFDKKLYKLADFGEAKVVRMMGQKQLGTLRGTELYMSPVLFNSLDQEEIVEHNPYKSDVFSLGYCVLLAATLSFNILYDLRKLTNKKEIHEVINKYLSNKFSSKFIQAVSRMVEFNEKFRMDFIQLKEFIAKNLLGN